MTILSTFEFEWLDGYDTDMKKKFPKVAQSGYQFSFTSGGEQYIATIMADYTDLYCSIVIFDTANNIIQPRLKIRDHTSLWFKNRDVLYYSKADQAFIFGSID